MLPDDVGTDDDTFRALFSRNDEESPMPDHDDLAETVRALHQKLNRRDHSPDMLRAVLGTLDELTQAVSGMLEHEGQVRKAVRRVERETMLVRTAQQALARATATGFRGVQKAVGSAGTPLQKAGGVTTTAAAPCVPTGDPRLTPALVKAMGQRLVQWFGPGGGYTVAYNRERATALRMAGTIGLKWARAAMPEKPLATTASRVSAR